MPVVRTYRPDERPDVEVLIDGHWCKSELRQWSVDAEKRWSAQVNWRRQAGETFIDTFPAARIRPDETVLEWCLDSADLSRTHDDRLRRRGAARRDREGRDRGHC